MRLFISYARVDKPYCVQIADTLDAHETWFDQRLYAGQKWWKEILKRLEWCEGFVYLLSPDSVASDYCRQEYTIAKESGRKVFPVLITELTPIPEELQSIHYADLSHGLTPDAVKSLLNAIYLAELELHERPPQPKPQPIVVDPTILTTPGPLDPTVTVAEAAEAMNTQQYDKAVFLLRQVQENGQQLRFIRVAALLQKAETELEKKTVEREAGREYRLIAELIKGQVTRSLGCESFQTFQQTYPNYDPDGLAQLCGTASSPEQVTAQFTLPLLEWCVVTEGTLLLSENNSAPKNDKDQHPKALPIARFRISKYPVTNALFQAFVDEKNGYTKSHWWEYSPEAYDWRKRNTEPRAPKFKGDDRPRESVTWYEAMAFCEWLSDKIGLKITLPTDQQWRRAARGGDDRLYPWGNHFSVEFANTRESKIKETTPVTQYTNALSPFGVFDMAGNVWEWCLNSGSKDSRNYGGEGFHAICGGSYISDYQRAQIDFHFNLNPEYHFTSIGFRVVALDIDKNKNGETP